ncbi:MAG: hypothetical protein ABH843_08100 [Candidatus Omnitrophota bacterium]
MIVKMKKVTILVSEKRRQGLLIKLRQFGMVHIKNINKPFGDEIRTLKEEIEQANKALAILSQYSKASPAVAAHREYIQTHDEAEEITSIYREKDAQARALQRIESQIEEFKPWGAFNPQDIKDLRAKGISIRLYYADRKTFRKMDKPEGLHIISEDKSSVYFVHLSKGEEKELLCKKVKPPEANFYDLYNKQEALQKRIGEIESILRSKTHAIGSISENLSALEKRLIFLDVKCGMKEEEGFSYLQGFCPEESVKDIAKLSGKHGFGYLSQLPDNPDETPTLIRNPKWISIINPIFKFMNTTPGYNECDISLWFLVFLSIFFALLIGDAGYGLLFAAATFFTRRKLKNLPPEPFRLMYLFSFTTIIWGAITGAWFGFEKIAQLPFLNLLVIDKINSFGKGNENFIIHICFIIGVVHLSIAHLITASRIVNSLKALAEIGWISVLWGLFFTAATLVLGKPFPLFAGYLLAVGAVLLVLFSNPQKNILKGILISLINIPLKIIGSFSDVVSYLRLFAVGYASVVVASSFNSMAMQLGFNNIITSLGAALILFLGHTLNITLGLMAVIVHGVRLNMLEFSGQIGMEWSGKEYAPFCEKVN